MSDFKIDKGIPVPAHVNTRGNAKYPWAQIEVGDSIFVAGRSSNQIASLASIYGKRHGCKFLTRTLLENGVKGTRIWRVE